MFCFIRVEYHHHYIILGEKLILFYDKYNLKRQILACFK